ncbi:membrane magnesium transporter [Selaginella moellendorffii]|nr:membrane magnesium transporter [Selaginella moellendorffii]|eukprot:XP_024533318.1 membrane magnesium transporter [Selaginella moellendorffii]
MGIAKKIDLAIGVLGVLLLAHAAHSTIQYRAALKIKEEEFSRVSVQILVEVLVSSALCLWAALSVPGTFLEILPDSKHDRILQLPENLDFMIFNHRGKLFPPKLDVN